jgi:hypothetical protein
MCVPDNPTNPQSRQLVFFAEITFPWLGFPWISLSEMSLFKGLR